MINFKSWNTIPKEFIGNCIVENKDSFSRFWLKQGKILHRENGPAMIYDHCDNNNSNHQWWINGERHRLDGPAVVSASQHILCEWWVEGMRHRLDGPAHISSFEEKYYINNVQYSIEDYMKHPLTIKFTMNSILDQ